MINVENRVLTNVKTYISDVCQTVQNDSAKSPASFPAVSVDQIDNPDTAVDLENAENAVVSMIEIQSFSNKNITEAKTIINKACDGMRIMGYVRQYGPKGFRMQQIQISSAWWQGFVESCHRWMK